ncbi:hypothetical protein H6G06_17390 [Anabaena sphaerica FACHB-251]|uniref:Uncharacterized protein n=1 Tax=Anabaena sphaerica FACHB-251 TaxID=2692883 RepID=A0A927A329_9NOST|nr:hypothetical protein [Anabaena sphaerica]MBD2295205.1 hypothetical protein [Anabaena sphaerica FACHB-251]
MSQDKRRKPRDEQETQPSPKLYQQNPPIWKTTIIQFLRGTIGLLENTVVKLETEPSPTTEKKPHLLERVLRGWDRFLQTFRLFLPSKVSNNVSDTVLTGILAVIAVVIVGTTTFLITSKPAEIATLPPVEEVPSSTLPEAKPEPIPTPTVEPEPIPTPTVEPEPIPTPTVEPEPEPIPTLEPEPEKIVELTPEQALIAAIENQLTEITVPLQQTGDENISVNLIKSIQANFRTSDLTIKISDDWYILEPSQQQQLAADILQRSQELDFTHLQLFDSQDKLIARSPVVGNEMIIFSKHSGVRSHD